MTVPICYRPHGRRTSLSDQGSAEPLFVLPVVFVMVLAVVQAGVWAHAQHRAQAVASQTLAAARAFDGTTAVAYEQAEHAQEQLGGGVLQRLDVKVECTGQVARVKVTGRAASMLPGVGVPVSSEASGPVEHLAP